MPEVYSSICCKWITVFDDTSFLILYETISNISIIYPFSDNMTEHVLFDGTLCYRPHTYRSGLMFQLRVLFLHRQTIRPIIIGAGGKLVCYHLAFKLH